MIQKKCYLMLPGLLGVFFILNQNLYAQDDCKVLMQFLEGEYAGDCKKGLAHGDGEAKGVDTYKGEFKKGLPHGTGTYSWKNGNSYEGSFKYGMKDGKGNMVFKKENKTDSIVTGYWSKDEYVGFTLYGYEIISRSSTISSIMVRYKTSEPQYIEIQGLDKAIDMNNNPKFYQFENMYKNIDYPIVIKLKGKSTQPNSMADLDFEILFERPGYWVVTVESL